MANMLIRSERVFVESAHRAEFLRAAVAAAERAGEAVLPYFRAGIGVENKAGGAAFDPVTEADRSAETAVRDFLGNRYPDHGFFGEEFGHQGGSGLTWVVDPIDGTRAFVTGMLHWGVLVALFDGQEPILGVMHQPFTGETFTGDGSAAHYVRRVSEGGSQLRTRPTPTLSEAYLATTGPQFFSASEELDAFNSLAAQVRCTRYGGDCYNYAMVAMVVWIWLWRRV